MSIVGQREINGDIWLTLECGHTVRREAYSNACDRCEREAEKKKPKPKKTKAKKRKKKKEVYVPYVDGKKNTPAEESKDGGENSKPFFWRGKMRY